ncbi:pyruvate synthase [Peptococcaceae bacterium SCADC1_2_3]|nr:pyruvate synthase [Peptococcaceae bacterium SCADC1_2_3]KFI35274.1 pyruvate synthase [Peptococcaceae bacterium SCADC1_2_3]KFI36877.1 pyruvate synthase [Peptococcaceae bacterium SCADC1_2_3]HBQ28996.1 pyruvate synthase [Desulfotomaculum sp.]HCJ79516.1 pyruvate synthase [Desulfotomaculum sp.]
MSDLIEIRWHSRGGQGAMVAVRTLARAVIKDNKYAQGLPEFGPERMGAPIKAYNRFSTQPFSLYCRIVNPHVVVLLDPSVAKIVDVTEGIYDDSKLLVNVCLPPQEVRERLKLKNGKIYTVDATRIAQETLGRPMPNTPMMGALIKLVPVISLEVLLNEVVGEFIGKCSPGIVEANLAAIKRGFEEVSEE